MQSGISAKKSDTQTLIFGKKDKQGKKRRIKKGYAENMTNSIMSQKKNYTIYIFL